MFVETGHSNTRNRCLKVMAALSADTLRRPDWRYRLAAQDVERLARNASTANDLGAAATRLARRLAGPALRAARFYNRRRSELPGLLQRSTQRGIYMDPDMASAARIYEEPTMVRWMLEALVMSRLSPEDVATKLGTNAGVVTVYEEVFFDVRDRLANELWVSSALLITPAGTASTEHDYVWKSVAYWHGCEALEALVTMKPLAPDVQARIDELRRGQQGRNILRATMLRQVNNHSSPEIMQEHFQERQLELAEQKLKIDEKVGDSMDGMLSSARQVLGVLADGGFLGRRQQAASAIECRVVEVGASPMAAPPSVFAERKPRLPDIAEPEPEAPNRVVAEQARQEHRSGVDQKKKLLAAKLSGKK